ncbi:MAG: hypothetical protein HS129_11430 [Leptospiraceae bacterium]|nr:hypothetical protein [Leptospiraceae bacterium]
MSYSQSDGFGVVAGLTNSDGTKTVGIGYSEKSGVEAYAKVSSDSASGKLSYSKSEGFGVAVTAKTSYANASATFTQKSGLTVSVSKQMSTALTEGFRGNANAEVSYNTKTGFSASLGMTLTSTSPVYEKGKFSEVDNGSVSGNVRIDRTGATGSTSVNTGQNLDIASNLSSMESSLDAMAERNREVVKEKAQAEQERKQKEANDEHGENVIEGASIVVSNEEEKIRQQTSEKSNETGLPDLPLKEGLEMAENQPMRKDLPELETIAKHLEKDIEKAWEDSNPDGKQDHSLKGEKSEHGFWILEDNKAGFLSKIDFPREGAKKDEMTPGTKPQVNGKSVIAWFHTHPNKMSEGKGYEPWESYNDKKFSEKNKIRGIIKSHNGMYYFGAE